MRISDWSSDVCSSDVWPGHCAAVPEAHVPDRTLADTAVAADDQHVVEAPATRLAGQVELGECPDVLVVRQRALVHEAGRAHLFWRRSRSAERRVRKECVGPLRSRWSQTHKKT